MQEELQYRRDLLVKKLTQLRPLLNAFQTMLQTKGRAAVQRDLSEAAELARYSSSFKTVSTKAQLLLTNLGSESLQNVSLAILGSVVIRKDIETLATYLEARQLPSAALRQIAIEIDLHFDPAVYLPVI
jgi:hypothetical protein